MTTQPASAGRIAILVADGFEQIELTSPRQALDDNGIASDIVSPNPDSVRGWNHDEKAALFEVDEFLGHVSPEQYDALLLPGGVQNPDALRQDSDAVAFIRGFFVDGKPVGAICHGAQSLIDADVVRGRTMTSHPAIQADLRNAGAKWVDEPVVEDGNLITSRRPDDLKYFNRALLTKVSKSVNA